MGFQFLHIEAYARHGSKQHGQPRKWSARERSPPRPCASLTPAPRGPAPAAPGAARLHPGRAAKLAHDWADSSQDAKGRKLRADGLALAAGVVSLPAEQRQDWPRFREATVAWLRQQYGERLRSVVEHTDEAHPICTSTPCLCRGAVRVLHPGRQAAAEKARQGAKRAHRTPHTSRLWWGGRMAFKGP